MDSCDWHRNDETRWYLFPTFKNYPIKRIEFSHPELALNRNNRVKHPHGPGNIPVHDCHVLPQVIYVAAMLRSMSGQYNQAAQGWSVCEFMQPKTN